MTRLSDIVRILRQAAMFSCVVMLIFGSIPLLADTISFDTASVVVLNPLSGGTQVRDDGVSGITSSVQLQGTEQFDGFTLVYSGFAAAQRETLHSSASYTLISPTSCSSPCAVPVVDPSWGVVAEPLWEELGVSAVTIGPGDLLSDIKAYKVTFNIDGSISAIYPGDAGFIGATVYQGNSSILTYAQMFAAPIGPVSFYIQPPDLTAPFNVSFFLESSALSYYAYPGAPTSASVDFSNTATLRSIEAVDANGNAISGVALEASDGSLLGYSPATPSSVPEPPSFLLSASGLTVLGVLGYTRHRRLRGGWTAHI